MAKEKVTQEATTSSKAVIKVTRCACDSPYQDSKYGPGLRVHNRAKGKAGDCFRCTVCGAERS